MHTLQVLRPFSVIVNDFLIKEYPGAFSENKIYEVLAVKTDEVGTTYFLLIDDKDDFFWIYSVNCKYADLSVNRFKRSV